MSEKQGSQPHALRRSILLREYMKVIAPTDRLPPSDLRPVLMGLFGEVGSIMATAKKLHREKAAYAGYQHAVEEEFGDALWYLTALCRRLGVGLDEVLSDAASGEGYCKIIAASDLVDGPVSHISSIDALPSLDESLLKLGNAAAALLDIKHLDDQADKSLRVFADRYLQALQVADVTFAQVVQKNMEKACGRFLDPDPSFLPTFDSEFLEEERLPRRFEIKITQRKSGQSYLQWNGVFVGDPLTDNILDPDGYRFHDVFHFAHACHPPLVPDFSCADKAEAQE
jgi:NTP pyrophosphatase (non-canonical NTP hydrolase)